MKKNRLMIITHDLAIGGLQQVVVNICKTINRDRFDVFVLCLRALGEFVPEIEAMGIKVFFIPQKKGTDYFSFLKVAKILKDQRIEIIHTHNTQPFVDGTMAALITGVKTIVHTDHARVFPDKIRYMVAEWLMSLFAYKVIGVSDHTAQNLRKYLKISPKKIKTILNGIDPLKYKIQINIGKVKKDLGISSNGPIIGTMGRLVMEKGIPYLLKAMQRVIIEFPNIQLLIVGDGAIRPYLEKEAVDLGVHPNVIFTGSRLDVPELLNLFDLFALSSISEGLPMVLLEAMAAGCSIVATKVGGIPIAIKNGENGSLVSPKNSEKLASAIIALLKDKPLRDKYVANGHKIFKENYDARIMTKQYEQLYMRSDQKPVY